MDTSSILHTDAISGEPPAGCCNITQKAKPSTTKEVPQENHQKTQKATPAGCCCAAS